MNDLEARIVQYPDLPPAEQQAVEDEVEGRPEQAALLAEVKALDRALKAAGAFGPASSAEVLDDEVWARFLASPRSGETGPPAFDRLAAVLEEAEEGTALHERCVALARRLRALEAESTDPAAHFEALAGEPPPTADDLSEAGGQPPPRANERVAEPAAARWRYARYAALAAAVVLVLYGALRAASRLSQSPMERLARVEGERLSVEGYGLRDLRLRGDAAASSSDTAAASLDERYLRGLRALRAARTSTLGLFPHYETKPLRRATRTLRAVAQEAEPGSFVQLEALFFLGKARLAQGDRAGATRAFRRVVAGGGRLAPEAQEILGALHEEAAYDGPPGGG
jgi:hypothetical protein